MPVSRRSFLALVVVLASGCGDDLAAPAPTTFRHGFPAVTVSPGQDDADVCQSWHVGNDAPLYVSAVALEATPGWHHSNWVFVPDTYLTMPDGNWSCSAEGFDAVAAGLAGGALFAQSTQARAETQRFPPGAAVRLPPHAVIVGSNHVFNTGDASFDAALTLELDTVPEAEVELLLQPLVFDFHELAIPPHRRSRFVAECDLSASLGAAPDLDLYWYLPHYHEHGRRQFLEAFGGPEDGAVRFESTSEIGEPAGQAFDPPRPLAATRGFRAGCEFDNPTDRTIRFGLGDGEMCILLAFTSSPFKLAGAVIDPAVETAPGSGEFVGACLATSLLPSG